MVFLRKWYTETGNLSRISYITKSNYTPTMSMEENMMMSSPNEKNNTLDLETQEQIDLKKQEVNALYGDLQDIDKKRGEHIEEQEAYKEKAGYTDTMESETNSSEFYTNQIGKELFSNKEKSLQYLTKLLEIATDEPEGYRRKVQDLIENFDDRKALFEQGADSIGAGAWTLLDKYAAQLPNKEIASLIENNALVRERRNTLQEKVETDPTLGEIKERQQIYNDLNNPTMKEIQTKQKIHDLKEEIKSMIGNNTDLL